MVHKWPSYDYKYNTYDYKYNTYDSKLDTYSKIILKTIYPHTLTQNAGNTLQQRG